MYYMEVQVSALTLVSMVTVSRVIEHSLANRMQTQNVAIVFGPTLMWPAQEAANMAVTMVCQNQVVELFILDQGRLFS